jgi:hypothetical protein
MSTSLEKYLVPILAQGNTRQSYIILQYQQSKKYSKKGWTMLQDCRSKMRDQWAKVEKFEPQNM